jgi:hypothetical protein
MPVKPLPDVLAEIKKRVDFLFARRPWPLILFPLFRKILPCSRGGASGTEEIPLLRERKSRLPFFVVTILKYPGLEQEKLWVIF